MRRDIIHEFAIDCANTAAKYYRKARKYRARGGEIAALGASPREAYRVAADCQRLAAEYSRKARRALGIEL